MNAARSAAYGRVMHTLQDLGPTKLWPPEQERIRDAADALLFCEDPEVAEAVAAENETFAAELVSSGRWTEERAQRLLDDLASCGPLSAVGHE